MPTLKHSGVYKWRRSVSRMLEHVDAFVTTSHATADVVEQTFPRTAEIGVEIIEHGRDFPEGTNPVAVPPIPGGTIRILFAGNLDTHKGLSLVKSLRGIDTDRRLEFHFLGRMGGGVDKLGVAHGPYERDAFHELAQSIAPAFAAVLSITAESYSHTLTEAWAAGIPVLVSNLGAQAERVRAQGGGWIVDTVSAAALYQQILDIADDREEYERVSTAMGRLRIRTVAEMATDYEFIYRRQLMSGRSFSESQPPAPLRIAVIAQGNNGLHNGSVHVRAIRRYWHESISSVAIPAMSSADRLASYDDAVSADIVIVERDAVSPELVDDLVQQMHQRGTKLVIDLDDDLVDIPESHPNFGAFPDDAKRSVEKLVVNADLVTASTPVLARRLRALSGNVQILPNALAEDLWCTPVQGTRSVRSPNEPLRVLF